MTRERGEMGEVWGWRGILGHISASLPGKVEQHLYRIAPEGVGFLHATLGGVDDPENDKEIEKALLQVDEAARRLAEGGANLIYLGSGPLVLLRGYGWDKELIKRLENITGLPSTTGLTCCMDAFRALGMKKLVIAARSGEKTNMRTKKFLEDNGFEVINIKSTCPLRNAEVRKLPMYVAYDLAKKAYLEAPHADGIHISCPLWGGPGVADLLERDLGRPVVAANEAFLWAGLRALNIREPVKGYGRLLEMN